MVQRKNNILIVGLPTPKWVRLSNGRTFLSKYQRRKSDLAANVTMRRRYKSDPDEADKVVEECKEVKEKSQKPSK